MNHVLSSLIKLARPKQWIKSIFVLVGPVYALSDGHLREGMLASAGWAAAAFALISSACYAFNDVRDAEADKAHPRKRLRPVASGAISPGTATALGAILCVLAAACLLGVHPEGRLPAAACMGLYFVNTMAYSVWLKHRVIADVMSLSLGFVLRVLGGCAAVGVGPTTYLLNATLFLAMFLAFGKRLGERRSLGENAANARRVQSRYSDATLRLAVMATGVVTLVTYAFYVISRDAHYTAARPDTTFSFNLLWLTMVPATYAMLRSVVLIEEGKYDDPTELASSDRAFQLAAFAFAVVTGGLMYLRHAGYLGLHGPS